MTTFDTLPAVEVTAGVPTGYSFGLFSLPPTAPPGDANRWEAGVTWEVIGCNDVGVTYGRCTVDEAVPELDPNVVCDYAAAAPFTIYAYSDESTGGEPVERKFARARNVLMSGEQWRAESVLWANLATAAGAADATADTVKEAIAMAEGLIADVYGGTPVIHLSRYAATMAGTDILTPAGNRLRTMLGSSVVAGGGYEPSPVATGEAVDVYVTGDVKVMRGAIVDLTGEAYSARTNELSALVFRTYAIGWDCAIFRVTVPAVV